MKIISMKFFKFEKPFSSFQVFNKYTMLSLKQRWRMALHDPAYLIILGGIILFIICI